jgi:hypothetical protein
MVVAAAVAVRDRAFYFGQKQIGNLRSLSRKRATPRTIDRQRQFSAQTAR